MKARKFAQTLSQQDIDRIIQLRLRGVTVQRIALILNKSHNTVRDVIKEYGLEDVSNKKREGSNVYSL